MLPPAKATTRMIHFFMLQALLRYQFIRLRAIGKVANTKSLAQIGAITINNGSSPREEAHFLWECDRPDVT